MFSISLTIFVSLWLGYLRGELVGLPDDRGFDLGDSALVGLDQLPERVPEGGLLRGSVERALALGSVLVIGLLVEPVRFPDDDLQEVQLLSVRIRKGAARATARSWRPSLF